SAACGSIPPTSAIPIDGRSGVRSSAASPCWRGRAPRNTDVRVGIIGFGGAGQAHLLYWSCIPGSVVTKILDPAPAAADRARGRAPRAAFFGDEDGFWTDLDAVAVCSPDSTHAHYAVEAARRGVHALVEKPLTDSVEGLRSIRCAARSSASVIAV